jgi:hypothetical protein
MMRALRWSIMTLAVTILAILFVLHWNLTMKSDLAHYRKLQAHLDNGEEEEAFATLAAWCKDNPSAPTSRYYSACAALLASWQSKSKHEALFLTMTRDNVLAGR